MTLRPLPTLSTLSTLKPPRRRRSGARRTKDFPLAPSCRRGQDFCTPESDPTQPAAPAPTRLGRFITFEGGEGVGKSTQSKILAQSLRRLGHQVILTREPGGTPWGEQLRQTLLSHTLDSLEELLILLAARRHHIAQVIAPALARGDWVICDRFIDSTCVYQGWTRQKGFRQILEWHRRAGAWLMPDLTLILDGNVDKALARRRRNAAACNRFDQAEISFHRKVRQGFQVIAARAPDRCFVISSDGRFTGIRQAILDRVSAHFSINFQNIPTEAS